LFFTYRSRLVNLFGMDKLTAFVQAHASGCLLWATTKQLIKDATIGCSVREVHASSTMGLPCDLGYANSKDDLFVPFARGQLKLQEAADIMSTLGIGVDHTCSIMVEYNLGGNPWIKKAKDAGTVCLAVYWHKTKQARQGEGTAVPGENGIAYSLISTYAQHTTALADKMYDSTNNPSVDRKQQLDLAQKFEKAIMDSHGALLLQAYDKLTAMSKALKADTIPFFEFV
jgi:hypothetical protein